MSARNRIGVGIGILLLFIFFFVVPISTTVYAQSIFISTTFPGIVATPGEKVIFPMTAENAGSASRNIQLKVVEAPEGWSTKFTGRGSEIHRIYVKGNSQENFNFEIQVPEEIQPGDYRFVLEGEGEGVKSAFALVVSIREEGESSAELTIDYPVLSGPSGTEFKYNVKLVNNSPYSQTFSLFAKVLPGWSAVFQPSYRSEQIASITLEGGATQGLDVKIKAPQIVEAGEYPIYILALGSLSSAELELKAIITGTYELNLTTPTGRLNARLRAGEETPLTLLVENRGSAELRNITLSASVPTNWQVTFEPKDIPILKPGESKEVTALLKADSKAIAGDYVATFRVRSEETSASADFRLTVLTPTIWGALGIAAVVVVLFGIFTVFKTYGRR